MKGWSSAVLVLAIAFSITLHFLLFRFVIPKNPTEEEPVKTFEVSLRYVEPAPVRVEQPARREVKREKNPVKKPQLVSTNHSVSAEKQCGQMLRG